MGWSKRGNGRSYDSLNGYAAIIGFMSNKVLDYTTRNRSAKAMEADAGAQLVNKSKILQDAMLNVGVLIGDEDSSTISAVRKGHDNVIYKLADKNHLVKHFSSELYDLANRFKELKKTGVISHLKKCFCYVISQNKGKTFDLASAIKSIPDHVYNRHENCGNWCTRGDDKSISQAIILKDELLYDSLRQIFIKYSNNASKFSIAASSQANESLNSVIASRAPKAKCYSRTESADFRVASAVLSKNEGDRGLLIVKEKLGLTSGKYTTTYCNNADKLRKNKSIKKNTRKEKLKRLQLTAMRQNLRKKKKKD
ncbi:uncharacterized protein [Linepithema humile]|uniref:uncharacterized protein n=1 Tax=Linepithema humile TaxID=83485 RepID=UPI00351DBE91